MKSFARQTRILASTSIVLLLAANAMGQRLLIETRTLAATGKAVALYLQSVDMSRRQVLPSPRVLPLVQRSAPLLIDPGSAVAYASTTDAGSGAAFTSAFGLCPFDVLPLGHRISPVGWRRSAAAFALDSRGGLDVVLLSAPQDPRHRGAGRLDIAPAIPGDAEIAWQPRGWLLPGRPVDAKTYPDGARVCVLIDKAGAGIALHVRDIHTGATIADLPLADGGTDAFGLEPAGLAMTPDGRWLVALTTGYSLEGNRGQAQTWVHLVDAESLEYAGPVIAASGRPYGIGDAIHFASDQTAWLATHTPGSGFAYATRLRIVPDSLEVSAELPMTGYGFVPLRLAISPDGISVAAAIDRRVELWAGGEPSNISNQFESSIGALQWSTQGLFVGEAGRLHALDPATAAPVSTVQLQTGHVSAIADVPPTACPPDDVDGDGLGADHEGSLQTDPDQADTDGDGICDGADPEPLVPSPRLEVAPFVELSRQSRGRDRRVVMVQSPHAEASSWRISLPEGELPWLDVQPRRGAAGEALELRLLPNWSGSREPLEGTLLFTMTGTRPEAKAAGSPAILSVRVAPHELDATRVLWLLGGAGADSDDGARARPFAALEQQLSLAPMWLSHSEVRTPYLESLAGFAVVVMDADAVEAGAVSRAALLDFVAEGGGLLFLARHMGESRGQTLATWLWPLEIHFDPAVKVAGSFQPVRDHELTRHWPQTAITDAAAMRSQDPTSVLVAAPGDDGEALFAARAYGSGRVAVMATAELLESNALTQDANRQFASSLFRWLLAAGPDSDDLDNDGIPDRLEDRNGNGIVDAGETDWRSPDSDGDGIPDGDEDRDRDGEFDDDETSPLNPDSDADGVWDGADAQPLPPTDAPVVAGASPPSLPAEGGYDVLVTGRNFAPDSAVFFGASRASRATVFNSTEITVTAPAAPSPEGGRVDVRVVNPGTGLEGVLPAGLEYGPVSEVSLVLEALWTAQSQYEGELHIRINNPSPAPIGAMLISLEPEPLRAVYWDRLERGQWTTDAARTVQAKAHESGLWLEVSDSSARDAQAMTGIARPSRDGEIAVLHWRQRVGEPAVERLVFNARRAIVTAPQSNMPLRVNTRPATLVWIPPVPRP